MTRNVTDVTETVGKVRYVCLTPQGKITTYLASDCYI